MVFRRPWLDLVLAGEKTIEVRHRALRAGVAYFLACRGVVYGSAVVSGVVLVTSDAQWRALLPQHRWDVPRLPYRRTFANSLTSVALAVPPLPYRHPRGAVGIALYRNEGAPPSPPGGLGAEPSGPVGRAQQAAVGRSGVAAPGPSDAAHSAERGRGVGASAAAAQ